MLNITLYTICYNEEIIIPFFIEHYKKFVNKIVVYDNYSTDNSRKILSSYTDINIIIKDYDSQNQIRDDLYLEIKNNCWKEDNSDFVIICDMDEFIYSENLIDFFNLNSNYDAFIPYGYEMVSDVLPDVKNLNIFSQIGYGVPFTNYSKLCIFKPNKVKEINYEAGCHYNDIIPKNLLIYNQTDLKLLHYKHLNLNYVINKHLNYKERLSINNIEQNWGVHYTWDELKITEEFTKLIKNKTKII
jgi:hypothetical protein